jgi:hypothetical protein
MNGLEKEYYDELKKNNKLVMDNKIISNNEKKIKNKNINLKNIIVEINKKIEYIKQHIKNWIKPGNEDKIYNFLYSVFDINKYIYGVLIAFDKNIYTGNLGTIHNEEYKLYAPHVYREKDSLKIRDVDINDYTNDNYETWYNLFESQMILFKSKEINNNIIIHSFPIFIDNKFYGMFGYSFELQKLNKICKYI